MSHYRVYWMLLDNGKRKFGHDTISSDEEDSYDVENAAEEIMEDISWTADDEKHEKAVEQMPNFAEAHGTADFPEDWKIRRVERLIGREKA